MKKKYLAKDLDMEQLNEMERLHEKFQNSEVCVLVKTIEEIELLEAFLHDTLFEITTVIKAKLAHGVYSSWLETGYELACMKNQGLCEVLSKDSEYTRNMDKVKFDEFYISYK